MVKNLDTSSTYLAYFFQEGANYRVYVLVPLLPAFEGDVGSGSVHAMHCVLHYQNNSIRELFERLERHGVTDPSRYLSFTSLRTWSELCGTPITELIYIHSKVRAYYQIPRVAETLLTVKNVPKYRRQVKISFTPLIA